MTSLPSAAIPALGVSGLSPTASPVRAMDPPIEVPEYLARTYAWAYLDPVNVRLLDRDCVANTILWGNYQRLTRAACAEFRPGEHVLQAASVYGSQPERLALWIRRIAARGCLTCAYDRMQQEQRSLHEAVFGLKTHHCALARLRPRGCSKACDRSVGANFTERG